MQSFFLLLIRLHNTDFIAFHWCFFFTSLFHLEQIQKFYFSVLCLCPTFDVVVVFHFSHFIFIHSGKKQLCKKSSKQKELHLCVLSVTTLWFLQNGSIYIPISIYTVCISQFAFGASHFFVCKQNTNFKALHVLLRSVYSC